MSSIFVGVLGTAEIFIGVAAFTIWLRRRVPEVSTALVYAVLLTMVLFSVLIQGSFRLGVIRYFGILEVLFVGIGLAVIWRGRAELQAVASVVISSLRTYKPWSPILLLLLGYLAIQGFLLPPANIDSLAYNLTRVALADTEGTLNLANANFLPQASLAWGYDILTWPVLRWRSDFGLASWSFVCYLTVLTATYSLVSKLWPGRRLAWWTVLVVASYTNPVFQATNTKNDLACAALATIALLAGYRLLKTQGWLDVLVLGLALAYSCDTKDYMPAFVACFSACFVAYYLWLHRSRWRPSARPEAAHWGLASLLLGTIACRVTTALYGYGRFGQFIGDPSANHYARNTDGVAGALATLVRYCIQIFEYPRLLGGDRITEFYLRIAPHQATLGMSEGLDLAGRLLPNEDFAWYGPLAWLLGVPAVIYVLWRGPGYSRVVALTCLGTLAAMCLALNWHVSSSRYLAVILISSAVCLPTLLDRMAKSMPIHRILPPLAIALMAYATFANAGKPLINPAHAGRALDRIHPMGAEAWIVEHLDFTWLSWPVLSWGHAVVHRHIYLENIVGGDRLERLLDAVPQGSHLLIVTDDNIPIYWIVQLRPDLQITASGAIGDVRRNDLRDLSAGFTWDSAITEDGMYDYILAFEITPPDAFPVEHIETLDLEDGSAMPGARYIRLYAIPPPATADVD